MPTEEVTPQHWAPTDIAKAIADGDESAESQFIARYRRSLVYVLYRRCGDLSMAEDMAHDALIVVLKRLRDGAVEDPAALRAFVHQTGINLLINVGRKRARQNTDTNSDVIEQSAATGLDYVASLSKDQLRDAVRKTILNLPQPRDRELLYSLYVHDEPKSSICARLDVSERHFDRVLYRAKQRFKELAQESLAPEQLRMRQK